MEYQEENNNNNDNFTSKSYYKLIKKHQNLTQKENSKENIKKLSNEVADKNNDYENNDINNHKMSSIYYSNNEKLLYISNKLNLPKTFSSSFENYKFYCAYNSFMNIRPYNEDKILINCQKKNYIKMHLFAIFDGHGGDKCSKYLMNNFDKILFSNKNLLNNVSKSLKETYIISENNFKELNKPKNLLMPIEKSGSCALALLMIGKKIYCSNAGDSRSLYSENGSKEIYQISYEHKPQNEIKRIKKAGACINRSVCNIWRLFPGGIAVRIIIYVFFILFLDFKIYWRFWY